MGDNIVEVKASDNCYAKIHLFGATVTSWVNNSTEQLYLSSLSKMDGSKAVRGGIPIVFPNFGPWSAGPQHGFARISWWKLISNENMQNGSAKAVFSLEEDEKTLAMWNYKFHLRYEVEVGPNTLKTTLYIKNTGTSTFDFTTLLHTYFKVSDINKSFVSGFKDCSYNDKVKNVDGIVESRENIKISENVDSVYAGTEEHIISSPGRNIKINKMNLPDTVLWNPWSAKAKDMSDFDDEGYLNMVCVEPGYVSKRANLQPGQDFSCSQLITVLDSVKTNL